MKPIVASLARIADLTKRPYDVSALAKSEWATGDYVVGRVRGERSALYHIEDCDGRMIDVAEGDSVLGALGVRAATLEGVGSWRDVENGKMHALTSAGLFGAFTSLSKFLPEPMSIDYVGHALRGGKKTTMKEFALRSRGERYGTPTIFLVGTSMNAGKTLAGALVCEVLSRAGLRVAGVKLTGAGRYRDILRFRQSGAFAVYDFVDAGLPSTVVGEEAFRTAIRPLLSRVAARKPDIVVAEAGASPAEPYNGAAAMDELGENIRCSILCASDPYAVVGVQHAFGMKPDLVTGPATNTTAAIDLVHKLSDVPCINIHEPGADEAMGVFLEQKLGVALTGA